MTYRLAILLLSTQAIWAGPTFQGRLINASTGRPISEASIVLQVPPNRFESPPPTRVTATDAQGRFALWAVPDGGYVITASRNGYVDTRTTQRWVKVPDQSGEPLVFKLLPQAIIRGRVVDEDGDIPPHASVSLERREFFNGGSHYGEADGARVRDDGTFVLGGILPGHYYLNASSAPNITGALERRLSKIGIVTFYPDAADKTSAHLIAITAGQEMNGVTIRLKSERLYHVRGHLDGIEKEQFNFFPQGGTILYADRLRVDSNGTFEIRLTAGDYVIAGQATQKSSPRSIVSIYQTLAVHEDLDGVVIHPADPSRTIHGRVRDERGQYPDLNGARMSLGLTSMFSVWSSQGYDVSGDGSFQGDYMSHRLIEGDVRAILYVPKADYYVKSIQLNGNDVTNRVFKMPVEGGEFEVTISSGAAGISGAAQTEKGRGDDGHVTIWSAEQPADGSRGFSATANLSRGIFKFENLAPGEYLLNAWEDIDPGLAEYPEFFKAFASPATRLTLKTGARETVTVTAIPRDSWESQGWKLR